MRPRQALTYLSHSAMLLAIGGVPSSAVALRRGFGPPESVGGLPTTSLPSAIAIIVKTALLLVGVLALAYLVYGGFRYITSRGDEDDTRTAKNVITYAIVGIVVIGLAYAVVDFVFCAVGGSGFFCL